MRRLVPLAWPVFVGQLAVLLFNTVDTVMLGRVSAADLAAFAVGSATFVTVFVGFMGVILAVGPIAGHQFGAGTLPEAGQSFVQAQWLAVLLALPGCLLLWWPAPFMMLAQLGPEQAAKVQAYTRPLALGLPFALVFTAFRGFAQAISKPRAVMLLQVGGLLLKVPLNALLIFGLGPLPAHGVQGAAWASFIVFVLQLLAAQWLIRHDATYAPFRIPHVWKVRPEPAAQRGLLRLGLPMGGSILVEVTGFTFMAFFIARLGETPVAGHQIAVNLVSMMFMLALAQATAAGTLVAQHLGAQEHDTARAIGRHALGLCLLVAGAVGAAVAGLREPIVQLYTSNAAAAAAALPLLVWIWFFHLADALQTVAAYVLRAYHVATLPMVIYVVALWGVGIGGGFWLAFGRGLGALGFWQASTFGLVIAASLLMALVAWVQRRSR